MSGALTPTGRAEGRPAPTVLAGNTAVLPAPSAPVAAVPVAKPPPPTVAQALQSGVLIVISKASQRMQVFKDGEPCLASQVSTGRRGHGTPTGVFSILEKQKFHRSNTYSNAPMPFMQRLTRRGIAIHAGYVPDHPASHGCIRLPYAVARSLFGLTRTSDTAVVIMNEPMQSEDQARSLALAFAQPKTGQPTPVSIARAPAPPPVVARVVAQAPPASGIVAQASPVAAILPQAKVSAGQTIQLAAALSPQQAEAHWNTLVGLHAELGRFEKSVVPVVVGSHRFFRLRASGPGAYSYCSILNGAGIACFKVR